MIPPSGSMNLLEWLTELREMLYVYQFIKGYDKGCRWTARWRDAQAKVWGKGAELPCPLQACHSRSTSMCSPIRKLSESRTFGIFMEASSCRHDLSLIPFSALSFLKRTGSGWGWKFQASNHGLVFLVTSPHPGAIQAPNQSHLIRTKDTPITQEITRVSGALCQEPRSTTKY